MRHRATKMYLLWGLVISVLTINIIYYYSVSDPKEQMLKEALTLAGNNRKELEKVLEYYKDKPEQQEAAKFLIRNMPGLFSYTGSVLDSLRVALDQFADSNNYDKKRFGFLQSFPYEQVQQKFDLETITAEYLIENIEYSFKAWKEAKWGKHISVENFYEYILPYRIGNEPLSHWKKTLYEELHPVLDSIYQENDVIAACDTLGKYLNLKNWTYCDKLNGPDMSAEYLYQKRIGDCEATGAFTTYAMRAIGIPVAIDSYIHSVEFSDMHCWNVVLDSTGTSIPFAIGEFSPKRNEYFKRKIGKAYRHTFAIQPELLQELSENKLPHSLSNCRLKDATHDYRSTNKVVVPCDFINNGEKPLVFLGVFSINGWIAIGKAESYKGGKATFRNIEPGSIYITLYKNGEVWTEAGYPFRLDVLSGETIIFQPEEQTETIKLLRKYPFAPSVKAHMRRMTNGRFEAANRKDFSDATVLYELGIKEWPQNVYNEYDISKPRKFRYVRYISNKKYPGDIAEVAWYSSSDTKQKLTGTLISTAAYRNQPGCDPTNAMDDDPLTFFSSNESPGWVGLDLGKATEIAKITYMPRNDDNFIRKGDEYELYYFSEHGWKSAGRQKAMGTELIYKQIPQNALFWLRNLTRGKEEQIFTYENGKQYFNYDRLTRANPTTPKTL